VFDYRTVGTMVDAEEVDRIMENLNRLQFKLQNKKADLSGELSRAHNNSEEIYDKFWPFSVSSNQVDIQEQLDFLERKCASGTFVAAGE
jgi:hypothetical protein